MTTSERYNVRVQGAAALFNFENIHYQQQQGFVPAERWVATRETLKEFLRLPWGPREVFESNPDSWRTSFRQVVIELLSEIDAEAQD